MFFDELTMIFEKLLTFSPPSLGVLEWVLIGSLALFFFMFCLHTWFNLFTRVQICAQKGLVFSRGSVDRQIESIKFNRIKAINVIKPRMGAIFNCAKIKVISRTGSILIFNHVKNFMHIKALLDEKGALRDDMLQPDAIYKL